MHTPGPWIVGAKTTLRKGRKHVRWMVGDSQKHTIVLEVLTTGRDIDERHDNAYLIAAAPSMYEAIKEYLEWGAMTSSDRDLFEQKFRKIIDNIEHLS